MGEEKVVFYLIEHSFLCSSGKIEGYDLPRGKLFGGQIGDNLREFLPTEQMLFLLNDLIINAATWLPGKNIRFFKDSIVYFPYRYVCAGRSEERRVGIECICR